MANIRLFEHSSIAGRQLFIGSPSPRRYVLASAQFLEEFEFNDITSSVRLSAHPKESYHTCYLFENDRFDGQFRAFAFKGNRNIISLPYFNDLTSSVILVSQEPGNKIHLAGIRKFAGDRINQVIDQQLKPFPEIKRNANVLLKLSIDAYEFGQYGKDLLKIEIPLEIKPFIPYGRYLVKLAYYIDLIITDTHMLKAKVAGSSYWISPGLLSGMIEIKMKNHLQNIGRWIESEINQVLHEFNWLHWKDVYLLPGLVSDIEKDYEGHVDDDCTVVFVAME
jgi:hypothetical protein